MNIIEYRKFLVNKINSFIKNNEIETRGADVKGIINAGADEIINQMERKEISINDAAKNTEVSFGMYAEIEVGVCYNICGFPEAMVVLGLCAKRDDDE